MTEHPRTAAFFDRLGRGFGGDELLDHVPDTVYFVKDEEGRYVSVNRTLVDRCGFERKEDLLGKTTREVFPPPLGESFFEQDRSVIGEGRSIRGELELHLYPNGSQGWCLTWKEPLTNAQGEVVGVGGISRDLGSSSDHSADFQAVSRILDHIRDHLDTPLRLPDLAEKADLSPYQLDQRIRSLFGLSAVQYITRRRIEQACHLLERTDDPIGFIALDCGYADQSAFTRQFRQSVGITPGAYREQKQSI